MNNRQVMEAVQIVCLFLLCYQVPDKTFNELIKPFADDFQASVKALRAMQGGAKDLARVVPVLSETAKKEYIRNYEQIARRKYDVIKVKPKICELVSMAQQQTLDTSEFPYVGPSPPASRGLEFQDGKKGVSEPAQRLIVFVAGGISHTEISALQAMEKEENVSELHNFVVGSTDLFSA
jgi:Sec1 family